MESDLPPQAQPPSRSLHFQEWNHHPTRCKSQKFRSPCHFPLLHLLYPIHRQHRSVSPPQDKHTSNECTHSSLLGCHHPSPIGQCFPRRPLLTAPTAPPAFTAGFHTQPTVSSKGRSDHTTSFPWCPTAFRINAKPLVKAYRTCMVLGTPYAPHTIAPFYLSALPELPCLKVL